MGGEGLISLSLGGGDFKAWERVFWVRGVECAGVLGVGNKQTYVGLDQLSLRRKSIPASHRSQTKAFKFEREERGSQLRFLSGRE